MRLETRRVLLRPFSADDLPYAVYLTDPAVMRYVEPAMSPASAVAFLKKYALCEKPLIWALEYRETGLLLGHAIFHTFEGPDAYELGWILDGRVWSQGIAAEIGRAMIVDAFARMEARRVVAETVPENCAARAVICKLGLRPCGESGGLLQFELQREDFCSCRG